MSIARCLGFVLVAAYTFSLMTASSATAAPLFLVHPLTGKGLLLLTLSENAQRFSTASGTVKCAGLKLLQPNVELPLRLSSILLTVDYENCQGVELLTAHPARLLIHANGLVGLESTVVLLGAHCTITMPSTKNQTLKSVKFRTLFRESSQGVLISQEITNITSFGTGTLCAYPEESKGTMEGFIFLVPDGGSIAWVA